MKWKMWLVVSLFALACQIANAENSVGNVISGDAKVEVLHAYSGSETLPKPDRIVIQDFTAVGDPLTHITPYKVAHVFSPQSTCQRTSRPVEEKICYVICANDLAVTAFSRRGVSKV